jgi:hypothetical protein
MAAICAAGLVAAAGVPALAGSANRSQLRTVGTSYSAPGGATTPLTSGAATVFAPGPAAQARPNETRTQVSAQDGTGRPVALAVDYRPAGAGADVTQTFCGSSPWLAIRPGTAVQATVLVGTCPDGQASAPTSGTVSVTFWHPLPPPVASAVHGIASPAQRWAVIIGIQRYSPPTEQTYGGRGDAAAVRKALLHAGWLPSHILDIRDGQATGTAILSAARWLVAHSSPTTFTLFHYSGHVCIASRGPCGSGHTYLWSSDNRFISEDTFAGILRGLRGHAWIDVAGCEAGAFDRGLHSAARIFTGSSQPARTSYEDPDWHESVWTGLTWDRGFNRGDAANGRPFGATISQMIGYGVRMTPVVTRGQSAGTQYPYHAGGLTGWRLSAPPA